MVVESLVTLNTPEKMQGRGATPFCHMPSFFWLGVERLPRLVGLDSGVRSFEGLGQ